MSNQDLDEIHAELTADHVYVHPALRNVITDADEAELEQAVTDAPHPTYIVVWPFQAGDEYGGKASDLLTRLHQRHPDQGVYLSTDSPKYELGRLESRQWDIPGEADGELADYRVTSTVGFERPPDLVSAFDRAIELMTMPPAELTKVHEAAATKSREAYQKANPSDYEDNDGSLVGPLAAGVAVLVAGVAVWRIVKSFQGTSKPQPLPRSAMNRIREAKDRELDARAHAEVLELGEVLDEQEIRTGDNPTAWQAALDHYAEARKLLKREDLDVLDVIGAIVLAERGQQAFTAARAGQLFTPEATCFLNPLHGKASKDRKIELDGRLIDVPVCTTCRSALRRKAVPDILDVVRRGQPKHYFETDAEPWASSGYGALDADLITQLQR